MSGIWRKYPEKKLSDKNNERIKKLEKDAKDHDLYQQDQYDIIKQKQTELKDKVHTVMEDQYLLEKSIKELKEQYSELDKRLQLAVVNRIFLREVLREFFKEMSFHYEVDGSRTNAAWMFFYDTLLEKLDGEKYGVTLSKEKSRKELRETNSKLSSYHITEKGKRALELIDSLGGENSIKNKNLV